MSDTQPSLIPSPKPVRLSASATLALPRWGILLLCLLYILPGLIGRDPWKNADAADFGVMWTMAQHGWQDWLWPNISGLPVAGSGPLTFWLGAICIKLFGGILGAPLAARLAPFLFDRCLFRLAYHLYTGQAQFGPADETGIWRTT